MKKKFYIKILVKIDTELMNTPVDNALEESLKDDIIDVLRDTLEAEVLRVQVQQI